LSQTLKKTTERTTKNPETGSKKKKMSQRIILISNGFSFWSTLVWRISVLKSKLEVKSQSPVSALNSRIIQFPYGKLFFFCLFKEKTIQPIHLKKLDLTHQATSTTDS